MTESRIYRISCGDAVLSVRLEGAGPPVLLIHGLTASRCTWQRAAPLLHGQFSLVLPDLSGRGDSPPREGLRYRLVDEVDRLGALLDVLGPRRTVAVGHSQGAAIALALAAVRQEVAGAVLVNPVTPWTPRPLLLGALPRGPLARGLAGLLVPALRRPVTRWVLERRVFTGDRRPSRAIVEAFARPYRDPRRARALVDILADWNPPGLGGYLPASPVAGSVLVGARDHRTPPRHAARLAERLDVPLVLMDETGHAGPLERARQVAEAVRQVAGRLQRRGAAVEDATTLEFNDGDPTG